MLADTLIELEQLQDVLAEKVWDAAPVRDCEDYVGAFFKRAGECEKSGDARRQAAHVFLGRLCTLHLDPDSDRVPLTSAGARFFPTIDDLSPDELSVLSQALGLVEDAELEARVADILWLTRAQSRATHEIAQSAVQCYAQSARSLYESGHQFGDLRAVDRLVRALKIARRLGSEHPAVGNAVEAIESLLARRKDEPAFPLANLADVLYDNRLGNARKYADYTAALAERAEVAKNWRLAHRYWNLASGWWGREGDEAASGEAQRRAAETHIGEAEAALKRPTPSHLVACHFLGQAIHELRGIPGQAGRIDDIHKQLLDHQKAGVKELITIQSDPVDLKDAGAAAESLVRGRSFEDAVQVLAFSAGKSPDVVAMRSRVKERGKAFLGMQVFGSTYLNQWGKVVDARPAVNANNQESSDRRIQAEIFQDARFSRNLRAIGIIEPMRQCIWREHNIRLHDLFPFVINNPFVPADRIRLFARGLFAGFMGEFDVATHMLIPQLENSLRTILAQRGVIVSSFDDNGIQMEFDLNRLLTALRPEVEKVFGVDLTFEMRGLLVERTGDNFRNDLAHGLVSGALFFSATAVFTWWMVLHLCCVGWMFTRRAVPQPECST